METSAEAVRKRCSTCGRPGHDRRTCGRLAEADRGRRKFDPWADLEWEEHAEARQAVADHPDGMTLEQIGHLMGITRERVRQIEAQAIAKIQGETDLAPAAEVDGRPVPLTECERCGAYFARRGRARICDLCVAPTHGRASSARPSNVRTLPCPYRGRRRVKRHDPAAQRWRAEIAGRRLLLEEERRCVSGTS